MKIFKYILLAIISLLITTISAVSWIFGTEGGLKAIVVMVQESDLGELKIGSLEGNLGDKLEITDFSFKNQETIIEVASFEFDWNPMALFSGKIQLEKLHIDGINVHLPESESPPEKTEPFKLTDIELPIQVVLEDIKITRVNVQIADAEPIIIDEFALKMAATDVVTVEYIKINSPQIDAQLAGEFGLTAPHNIEFDLNWAAKLPELTITGQGKLHGNMQKLVLEHTVNQPLEVNLNVTVQDIFADLKIDTVLTWQQLRWPLVGKAIATSRDGKLNFSGSMQNYQVKLVTQLAGEQIPKIDLDLKGQGNLEQFNLQLLQAQLLDGSIHATGKAKWQPKLVAQLDVDVGKINIKQYWADWPEKLRIDSKLVAQLDGDKFQVHQFKIQLPPTNAQLLLKAEGKLAGAEIQLNPVTLDWQQLQWPLVGTALAKIKTGQLKITGTPKNYQLNLETELTETKQVPATNLTIIGSGNLQQFNLETLRSRTLNGQIYANGKLKWQPKLEGNLNLTTNGINIQKFWQDWPKQHSIKSKIVAQIIGEDFKIQQFDIEIPPTKTKIAINGFGKLAGENSQFDTNLTWENVKWPLVDSPALLSINKGNLAVFGTAQSYQMRLNTDLQGKDIPAGSWQASGFGNLEQFNLNSLHTDILTGYLDLSGQVRWKPKIDWSFAFKGDKINPGVKWADFPGKIAIDIRNQGRLNQGKLETTVNIKHIKGKLRDYPLQLQAQEISIQGTSYKINNFRFNSGKNYIIADGKLGNKSKLTWEINIPNLSNLLPEAKGNIVGKGKVTGPINLPHIVATLKAKHLSLADNKLNNFNADIDINLLTGEKLRLNLTGNKFQQAGLDVVDNFKIKAQGNFKNHFLEAKINLPTDSLGLKLRGGFNLKQSQWRGKLQKLSILTKKFDNWQLYKPSKLTLSAEEVKLSQTCLQNKQAGKLCTQLNWKQAGNTDIKANLTNISLSLLDKILTNASLTGELNGNLQAKLQADGVIFSDAAINISPGKFEVIQDDIIQSFSHQGGQLKLKISQATGLNTSLNFELLKKSRIKGQFKLPKFYRLPFNDKQAMRGNIKILLADLDILPTFLPQLENTKGQVNIDLNIAGTPIKPDIQGQIEVKQIGADIIDAGITLRDSNLLIRSEANNKISLNGQLNSGEGQINLSGNANFKSATDWKANLHILGEKFEVVNIPDAWGLASPNIKINLKPELVTVKGKIHIPELVITPLGASSGDASAVMASKDVIIIDTSQAKVEVKEIVPPIAVSSNIKVTLGENVSFDGMGFESNFGGGIIISSQPGKMPIANGELNIIEGRYKAYGQDLRIDQGRIFFSGGPVENPGLDIRAYRLIKKDFEEIIAGIYIHGTAQVPKMDLYSIPAFDQSNTLSYIIIGKSVAEANQGEGDLLLTVATAMPFTYGNNLAKKLGKEFGLDEANINTDEGIEKAALVLGKYLNPKLYISYGIGLFDSSQVVRMRYQLTDHFTVETETGTQSGIDLHYSLER